MDDEIENEAEHARGSLAVPCSGQSPYMGYEPTGTCNLGNLDLQDEVKSHHEENGVCFETHPVTPGDGNHGNEDKKITSPPGIDEDHEGRLDSVDSCYASGDHRDHSLEALPVGGHQHESAAAAAAAVDGSGEGQGTSATKIQVSTCEDLDVTADSGVLDDTSLLSVTDEPVPDGDGSSTTIGSPAHSRTHSSSSTIVHVGSPAACSRASSSSSHSSVEVLEDPFSSFITDDQSVDTGFTLEGSNTLPFGSDFGVQLQRPSSLITDQSDQQHRHFSGNNHNISQWSQYMYDQGEVSNAGALLEASTSATPNGSPDEDFVVLPNQVDGLGLFGGSDDGPVRRSVLDVEDRLAADIRYPPMEDFDMFLLDDDLRLQLQQIREQHLLLSLKQTRNIFEKSSVAKELMPRESVMMIERHELVKEVIDEHRRNPEFWKCVPLFTYRGESGIDAGGITRDVFARFWKMGRDQFCQCVPVSLNCFDINKCPAEDCLCDMYSKIWAQSLVLGNQLPMYAPEGLVLATVCSPNEVTPFLRSRCVDLFKGQWRDYEHVRFMLEDCVQHGVSFDNRDEVVSIFDMYDYKHTIPLDNPESFRYHIERMVINWLFGPCSPHFIQLCRAKLFEIFKGPLTASNANKMWGSLQPTWQAVTALLQCPLRPVQGTPEFRAFEHLKKIIKENGIANREFLSKLLTYITGSPSLTAPQIIVEFSDNCPDGIPKVSTCANHITLPTNLSYDEFSTKLTILLASAESEMFTDD